MIRSAAAHERPNAAAELVLVVFVFALCGAADARVGTRAAGADVDEGDGGRKAGFLLGGVVPAVAAASIHGCCMLDVVKVYAID